MITGVNFQAPVKSYSDLDGLSIETGDVVYVSDEDACYIATDGGDWMQLWGSTTEDRQPVEERMVSFQQELDELAEDLAYCEEHGFPASPEDPGWIAHCAAQRRRIGFSTEGEERMRITNEGVILLRSQEEAIAYYGQPYCDEQLREVMGMLPIGDPSPPLTIVRTHVDVPKRTLKGEWTCEVEVGGIEIDDSVYEQFGVKPPKRVLSSRS